MLEKREKYLQTKIDAELTVAKANATKNKRGLSYLRFNEKLIFCGLIK
jgi:charged multivesicular body protein 4